MTNRKEPKKAIRGEKKGEKSKASKKVKKTLGKRKNLWYNKYNSKRKKI
jgi:hypothetical protein